jgi:tetratricopeptide (TPR) repeat protein
MTFFGILNSPIAIVFTVLSMLNFVAALRVAGDIRRRWAAYQQEPMRPWQKQTLERAAFLLGIPLGVLVHEVGHAIAVLAYDGAIVDAGYAFYWGYVGWQGQVTVEQRWLIAMAGTIGSLVYGFAVWFLLRRDRRTSFRYLGLRVMRVHLFYSLIYYPIFTFITRIGDWEVIYDFGTTPQLSAITLVAHAATLAVFFWTDRRGLFEMPAFASQADQEQFEALQARAAANPGDAEARLKLADAYRRSGLTHLAKREINQLLGRNPDMAEAYVQLAAVQAEGKRQVPKNARDNAEQALALGLSNPQGLAFAHMLAGQYSIGVNQVDKAINHYSEGIAAARQGGNANTTGRLYYLRAAAYRRKGQYPAAEADIQEAIARAQHGGQGQLLKHYEAELEALRRESNN